MNYRKRGLIAFAAVLLIVAGLTGHTGTHKHQAAAVSYSAIVGQFMCVSCHEPLNLVDSPQAISEKQQLRRLVKKRLSMSQIKNAMVSQYGTEVLGKPPAHGFNLSVYGVPLVGFGIAVLILALVIPRWRRRAQREAAKPPPESTLPLAPEDAKRLDDDLADFI